MATIDWPDGLANSLQSAKRVERVGGYRESSLAAGPALVERFSDDTPTFFDVSFGFTRDQARGYDAWVELNDLHNSGEEFNFPVLIPDTNTRFQEVRWVDRPAQRNGQAGSSFVYTGRLLARSIVSTDLDNAAAVLTLAQISKYRDIDGAAELLDIAINISAPEV